MDLSQLLQKRQRPTKRFEVYFVSRLVSEQPGIAAVGLGQGSWCLSSELRRTAVFHLGRKEHYLPRSILSSQRDKPEESELAEKQSALRDQDN